jgi:hypothetical protein
MTALYLEGFERVWANSPSLAQVADQREIARSCDVGPSKHLARV